jgi:hypothetical protein
MRTVIGVAIGLVIGFIVAFVAVSYWTEGPRGSSSVPSAVLRGSVGVPSTAPGGPAGK